MASDAARGVRKVVIPHVPARPDRKQESKMSKYQLMPSMTLASAVPAADMGGPVGKSAFPWGRALAPILSDGSMDAFYFIAGVEDTETEDGREVTSATNARTLRTAARVHAATKRPRERWTFRARPVLYEENEDGSVVPRMVTTTESDLYALWGRLLRVADTNGNIRDCGDDAALQLADDAHAETLARVAKQAAINAAIAAEAKRRGIDASALRKEIAAEATRRGVKVSQVRQERGLEAIDL
jgi:hypothetical protein